MLENTAAVSVIVPTYNQAYLLASMLDQNSGKSSAEGKTL